MVTGFFYDVANGTVIQPQAPHDTNYVPSFLCGIGYRTSGGQQQLILDGNYAGLQANWMTTDGGATWGASALTIVALQMATTRPVANSLGAVTGSDKFYILNALCPPTPTGVNDQRTLYTCKGSGAWSSATPCTFSVDWFYIDNPDAGNMNGVAGSTGRAVGYYRDKYLDVGQEAQLRGQSTLPRGGIGWPASYVGTWAFNGLDGTVVGEAFSVSSDGNKIFGRSPTPTDADNWHGYKAVVTSATNSLQSIHQLPDFTDTGGSIRLAYPLRLQCRRAVCRRDELPRRRKGGRFGIPAMRTPPIGRSWT